MPSPRLAADDTARGAGDAAWLVLDLIDATASEELAEALEELAPAVDGITVLVAPGPAGRAAGDRARRVGASVAQAAGAGAAQRLAGAEVPLPAEVGVIVYGDHRLLAVAERASVAEVLARLGEGDVALARGAPVTDSLRRVDDQGRLVGCVDRTDLLALVPPHTLRREVVAELAVLAVAGGADGSVEAGLVRTSRSVRVVELDGVDGGASPRAASAPSPAG